MGEVLSRPVETGGSNCPYMPDGENCICIATRSADIDDGFPALADFRASKAKCEDNQHWRIRSTPKVVALQLWVLRSYEAARLSSIDIQTSAWEQAVHERLTAVSGG